MKLKFSHITESSIKSQSKYLFGEHAPSLAKALFRCLNCDGDGKVDFEEFRTFMHIVMDESVFKQQKHSYVKILFKVFDRDEDGVLTWDDLTEMASSRMYKIDKMLTQI